MTLQLFSVLHSFIRVNMGIRRAYPPPARVPVCAWTVEITQIREIAVTIASIEDRGTGQTTAYRQRQTA